MVKIEELPFKERNIRKYKNRYAVRFMRRAKTLAEAKNIERYIEQFINCVSIYQDKNKFIVQTYKEFKDLEEAIKIRNYLDMKLKEYKEEIA